MILIINLIMVFSCNVYAVTEDNSSRFSTTGNSTENSCDALLGDPNDSTYPAYWLEHALNIIRYAAIIALLVLSSYDFIRAIISQDGDALKKATNHLYKRLLYCVIIFFVPTIMHFIFTTFGIEGTVK